MLQDPDKVMALVADVQPPLIGIRAIATLLNSVKNDGPELIVALDNRSEAELQLSVGVTTTPVSDHGRLR